MSRRRAAAEDGYALLAAIALLAVMLVVGLASYASVQTAGSRALDQRERESSLNLAEAVLYSQSFVLAQAWPGNSALGAAMPSTCTSAAVVAACPDPRNLAAGNAQGAGTANFTSIDVAADVTWTTRVRDNGGLLADSFLVAQADAAQSGTNVKTGAAYTCPAVGQPSGPCKWDANGDLMVWVQARAVVRGHPRNLVALLKREEFVEPVAANNTVQAGSVETTNSGNKVIVDARGSQMVVRCTSSDASCTDINTNKGQVLPPVIVRQPSTPPGMSAAQMARFKAVAQSASPSTYYTTCPPNLTGKVVYIDVSASTACKDGSAAIYNTDADPGIVIVPRGTFELQGSYHGILYAGNEQNTSGPVIVLDAGSEVFGGVVVDGPGRLVVGQASGNSPTITYKPNAYNSLFTYGTTGLVQNTWRELAPT
jgi:Tfp pilus assembly protein PilX